MAYAGEYADVEKTKFWSVYSDRLFDARDKIVTALEKGRIEEPRTLGTSLQECLRMIDSIINLPLTIMRDKE